MNKKIARAVAGSMAMALITSMASLTSIQSLAEAAPIPVRGVVEGFYGQPWSLEMRQDMLDFMKEHQLNAYIYAPKDDPYHRDKWREPYPVKQRVELETLSKYAQADGIQFIFAVSPGLDLNFTGVKADADKEAMLNKLNMMYDMGIRQFALFFDDIKDRNAEGQANFINYIDKNFVAAKGDVKSLIVVPSEYFLKDMASDEKLSEVKDYTATMSQKLNRDIIVLNTGLEVCPDGLSADDIAKAHVFYPQRQIGIWWNYPVNDYLRVKPALGPLDKMSTSNDVEAFFMNPMEREQLSKIALATGADYALDSDNYNETKSWEKALQDQYGSLATDMMVFAGENQRLENNWAHIGHADDNARNKLYEQLQKACDEKNQAEQKRLIGLLLEDTDGRLDAYKRLRKGLPDKVLAECYMDIDLAIRCYSMEKENLEILADPEAARQKMVADMQASQKRMMDDLTAMEAHRKAMDEHFRQIFGDDFFQ